MSLRAACWLIALVLTGTALRAQSPTPTPEEYAKKVGGDARVVPAGEFTINGQKMICGNRPTVIDNRLDDYGAAYPGFLIMNTRLLARTTPTVQMWIYSHECGHQFRGPDEETADCFAVQRGRRQKWLTPEGLNEICSFISPAKGDSMHFKGAERCEAMRRCYADPSVR